MRQNSRTFDAIGGYMGDLIKEKRRHPQDDMLSGLANHATPAGVKMGDYDLIATAILMLVAGHETTVNLITNGLLTLLRHPDGTGAPAPGSAPSAAADRGAPALRAAGAVPDPPDARGHRHRRA